MIPEGEGKKHNTHFQLKIFKMCNVFRHVAVSCCLMFFPIKLKLSIPDMVVNFQLLAASKNKIHFKWLYYQYPDSL